MSDMYGVYAPYVSNLINCCIEPAYYWGQPLVDIRGLTSDGEFVVCHSAQIFYLSFESVKKAYNDILARGRGRRTGEAMTDEEVVESFITGIFFERGKGRLWIVATTYFDITNGFVRVSICGDRGFDHQSRDVKIERVELVEKIW